MPGTIRITVQELVELKAPGGKKFGIQVSLAGTTEESGLQGATPDPASSGVCSTQPYNATFSFTSFSLKDLVEISLIDAWGVPVGTTTLPVTSIVSKGSRDELLVLSNGGRIRIQSNFSLNEAERARIAALKATTLAKRGSPSASPRRVHYAEWKAERQPGMPGRTVSATSARGDADPLSIPEGAPLAVGSDKSASSRREVLPDPPATRAGARAGGVGEPRVEAEDGARPEGAAGEDEEGRGASKKGTRGKGRIVRQLVLTTIFVAGVVLLWPQKGPKGLESSRSREGPEDKDADADADVSGRPKAEKKRKPKKPEPVSKADKSSAREGVSERPRPAGDALGSSSEAALEPPPSPRFAGLFGLQAPDTQSPKS